MESFEFDLSALQRRGLARGPVQSAARFVLRRMNVGQGVSVGEGLRLSWGASIRSPHGLDVGNHVSVGQRSVIEVDGYIGDFTLIGRSVQVVGRMDHAIDEVGVPMALATWVGDRAVDKLDQVHIGRDVWIGGGAIVLGGTRIGDGAVIGAGAIVTRDIEPFGIAVGAPARVISLRFSHASDRQRHLAALDSLAYESKRRREAPR